MAENKDVVVKNVVITIDSIHMAGNVLRKNENKRSLIEKYMASDNDISQAILGMALDGYPFN